MEEESPSVVLRSAGSDSITLIGGRTRRVLLATASRRLVEGEDCLFVGNEPGGVWHVHVVFTADQTPRRWVDYAREFVVILPKDLAVAKCEDAGSMAVLYNIES